VNLRQEDCEWSETNGQPYSSALTRRPPRVAVVEPPNTGPSEPMEAKGKEKDM
jgi:hypothetical protein